MNHPILFPYYADGTLVNVMLFVLWSYVFGLALGWGMRTANKLP